MHKLTQGIGIGQAIDPNHILRIAHALAGIDTNDIVIKGTLTSLGNFGVYGDSALTGSLYVSSDILITGSIYGSEFFIKDGNLYNKNIYTKNIITNNIIVSSSLVLKNIQQNQSSTIFLSIDPSTKIVSYSTGSLSPENQLFYEKFKFTSATPEDCTSFNRKIYNLSLRNTDAIEYVEISSKLDIASLNWTRHFTLDALQAWIEKETDDGLYWIKISVSYKKYLTGNAESILTFTE